MFKSLRASSLFFFLSLLVFVSLSEISSSAQRRQPPTTTSSTSPEGLKALQWRQIGPFRGGRSTAVAGVASQPMVFYFGGTGGGVWKTTDGGINWEPITDNSVFSTGSVGAIGLSDSDPNTIYVGMGESPIRGNVSHGDGDYKSTDAGKTWKRIGLEDTRQISRIRVHFFFQAEDGIRAGTVTGVETCALPISPSQPDARAVISPLATRWSSMYASA